MMASRPPYYAYVHVAKYECGSGRRLMIQYWLYYAYNELDLAGWEADIHHHDWESVFIIFDMADLSSLIEAVYNSITSTQGFHGRKVEKVGIHPVVYVARYTHAAYEHPSSVPPPDAWEPGGMEPTMEDFERIYIAYTCSGEIPQDHWVGNLLHMIVGSLVDLHVWDPLGRHIGINYVIGEVEIEIPNATFRLNGIQEIVIPNPMNGEYIVKIIGRERGSTR